MCDLGDYGGGLGVGQEGEVQEGGQCVLQGGVVVVQKAVEDGEEAVILQDLVTALFIRKQITYQFDGTLLSPKLPSSITECNYFLKVELSNFQGMGVADLCQYL